MQKQINQEILIMSKPVTLAVIGAGARGCAYARFAKNFPDRLKIVAVADPTTCFNIF